MSDPTAAAGGLRVRIAVGAALLLVFAGAFLPGSWCWGFNALAYLPRWVLLCWSAAALSLAWPRVRRFLGKLLDGSRERINTGAAPSPAGEPSPPGSRRRLIALLALLVLVIGISRALRVRTYFLGDGYLLGQLLDSGVPFRGPDNLDYLGHFQIFRAFHRIGLPVSALGVYAAGSNLAGLAAIILQFVLLRRVAWEGWRRRAAFGLLFLSGPVVLYLGYVESYTFLFLWTTAFLVSGLLVMQGRMRLYQASIFFGLGLMAHLTALVSAPALLYLMLRAPNLSRRRRWGEAVGPVLAAVFLSAFFHILAGYDAAWFRREFLQDRNLKSAWIPLSGPWGLFSARHAADLFNLFILCAPVALAVVLGRARDWLHGVKESEVRFLLVQCAGAGLAMLTLDPKLGAARDWDLLAAQAGGILLLGAAALPAGRSRNELRSSAGLAVGAACLITLPWVLLLHSPASSMRRLADVAAGFSPYPRASAFEELGRYYRNASADAPTSAGRDSLRVEAETMYHRCVQAYPGNPRFHILLAQVCADGGKPREAEKEYRAALALDPSNPNVSGMCCEMLGKLALVGHAYAEALDWFHQLTESRGGEGASWELLGYAAVGARRPEEAAGAFRRAMEIDPSLPLQSDLAGALYQLGRFSEAAGVLRQSLRAGRRDAITRYELAMSLIALARQGARPAPEDSLLAEAESQARAVLAETPGDRGAEAVLDSIRAHRSRAFHAARASGRRQE